VPYEGRGLTAVSLIAKLFLFFVTHKFASEKATNSEVYRWLQMKPDQLEIERLQREVAKLKAERDILKKAAAYFARDAI
jgi:transposase-like protein